jgi:hypothetical protein
LYNDIVTKLSVCLAFPLLRVPAPLFPEKRSPEHRSVSGKKLGMEEK